MSGNTESCYDLLPVVLTIQVNFNAVTFHLKNSNFNIISWQVAIVKWLVCWVHNPAIQGRFLAGPTCRPSVGRALKILLREPPCGTCKKDQSSIKLQDYWSGSLDQLIFLWYNMIASHAQDLVLMLAYHACCVHRKRFRIVKVNTIWYSPNPITFDSKVCNLFQWTQQSQ